MISSLFEAFVEGLLVEGLEVVPGESMGNGESPLTFSIITSYATYSNQRQCSGSSVFGIPTGDAIRGDE